MAVSSAGTIAEMQAIFGPRDNDVVEVGGGVSPHDGGGGTFFFDATRIIGATVSSADITDVSHGPIGPVVVTAVGHPFHDGQVVEIAGVRGNTDANGVWPIKNLSKETFALLGSRSNGAYTGGGKATSVTVRTSAAHRWVRRRDDTELNVRWFGLSPTTTAAAGGRAVTITSTNLADATRVELSDSELAGGFGERDGTIAPGMNTATSLTFTVPKRRPGNHTVLVMTRRGASNLLPITMT